MFNIVRSKTLKNLNSSIDALETQVVTLVNRDIGLTEKQVEQCISINQCRAEICQLEEQIDSMIAERYKLRDMIATQSNTIEDLKGELS